LAAVKEKLESVGKQKEEAVETVKTGRRREEDQIAEHHQ
jgi:hypothetical protein